MEQQDFMNGYWVGWACAKYLSEDNEYFRLPGIDEPVTFEWFGREMLKMKEQISPSWTEDDWLKALAGAYRRAFASTRTQHWAGHASYADYLQSPHWRDDVRPAALERAGHKCQVCGKENKTLNVHHNTYERLGRELPTDVVVLCQDCHGLFHAEQKREKQERRMYVETNYGAYIEGAGASG